MVPSGNSERNWDRFNRSWRRNLILMKGNSFLASLTEEERSALQKNARRRLFPLSSTIFLEGDTSDHLLAVLKGKVKVSYLTDDGREVILAVREPGDLLGELSAIDSQKRSATAIALEPVTGLLIESSDFKKFLFSHPRVAIVLLTKVIAVLRDSDRKRVEFGAIDTEGRVAARLVELAERFGKWEDDGFVVALPITQEEIASWVGASRRAVTKALANLRSRELIDTGRKNVIIKDLERLRLRAR